MSAQKKSPATEPDFDLVKLNDQTRMIKWHSRPFVLRISVLWRGRLLHFEIRDETNYFGATTAVTLVRGGNRERFGVAQFKYSGGSIGSVPEINCATHSLHLQVSQYVLTFTEKSLNNGIEPELSTEPAFQFLVTPKDIQFSDPLAPATAKMNETKVTLYKYEDTRYIQNSYAGFENEDLVVDKWIMGKSSCYEDEYSLTVKPTSLARLYQILGVETGDKPALLRSIRKQFKGKESYDKFRVFLDKRQIGYESSVRHDD